MSYFLIACCLVLVIEGLMPALAPQLWRNTIQKCTQLTDDKIRIMGLVSMTIGAALLFLMRQ